MASGFLVIVIKISCFRGYNPLQSQLISWGQRGKGRRVLKVQSSGEETEES